jgi:Polyketide cyclase / dehydrase and lipid transport
VTSVRASVRRHVRIARPADDVWAMVGDPARLPEWYPGIPSCTVDGDRRVIVTGSGLPIPQQLLTIDPMQRRFQYRVTAPMFREHLATIDVYDLEDGTCLVAYAVDADPATMALVLGGAGGNALRNLRRMMEGAR